ncbi:hypothetical protein [Chitinimonas sp. BJYL2]|uniref:hypothetical protein n=1 Tax=Chitinimonas sp. BJYL2 TaxID=2976696 RepID=UPI0022B588D3|nr:hypothetical protein [Chitinimonas sp. BJYL2]
MDIQSRGEEVEVGSKDALPIPLGRLVDLREGEAIVRRQLDSGLTARVFQLNIDGKDYALKQARPECLVQNDDGRTSFLNELQCRQQIEALRRTENGEARYGAITQTLYGSLRKGLLLSEWVNGERITAWDERQLDQLFQIGGELILAGLFEWDYSSGNLLDDGQRIRLFDFGYMYPIDPCRHFNSSGDGTSAPLFHLAERFETRCFFAWLLQCEQSLGQDAALAAFRREKEVALGHYERLIAILKQRGATAEVLAWWQSHVDRWQAGLRGDLAALYLAEGWRSHMLDLDDDLRGQTCTPMTLQRADWLLHALRHHYADLNRLGAFFWHDKGRPQSDLLLTYRAHRDQAVKFQVKPAMLPYAT